MKLVSASCSFGVLFTSNFRACLRIATPLTKYARPLFGKDCAPQESRVQPQFDISTFQELDKMMLNEGFAIMVYT